MYLLSSCDKQNENILPDKDPTETGDEEEYPPVPEKPVFEERSIRVSVSEIYIDGTVDRNFYLGTVWGLKDTVPQLELTPLHNHFTPFDITATSTSPLVRSISFMPSFDEIRSYALQSKASQSVMGQYSTYDFSDYRTISYFIYNNADVACVLKLVEHNDSTTIKRAHSSLIYGKNIQFELMTDFGDFARGFSEQDVAKLKQAGFNPYYVSMASYGTHYILMAESDSSRTQFNRAFDKLLDDQSLSETDKAVLSNSDLLVYLRGGGKDSFIKRESGLIGITSLVTAFKEEFEQQRNLFDFPISYRLWSVDDFSSLGYQYSYDILARKEEG